MGLPPATPPAQARTVRAAQRRPQAFGGVYRVPEGVLRRVILAHARDVLRQVRAQHVRRTAPADGDYRQLLGAELPEAHPPATDYRRLVAEAHRIGSEFPSLRDMLEPAVARLSVALDDDADVTELWQAWSGLLDSVAELLDLAPADPHCQLLPNRYELEVWLAPHYLDTAVAPAGKLPATDTAVPPLAAMAEQTHRVDVDHALRPLDPAGYLAALGRLSAAARRSGQRPSREQLMSEWIGFDALARGHRARHPARPLGTSGFREHQTWVSVADPGEGHLDGTLRDGRHLDGVIVQIGHLEYEVFHDRTTVEPYRLPHPHLVAQVQQVLAGDAPASAYIGRPVFESAVEESMLKSVHTIAATCSALFDEGLSECTLTIEGMTARQAIKFMRAVRAAVRRDHHTQLLSAAININTPMLDDRVGQLYDANPVTGRLAIGLLGVELAHASGFDKIVWDGTGISYPGRCVLEQLRHADALTLVHRAHELGLLTHFSAGFHLPNLAQAVHTGVDGLDLDGTDLLRYVDRATGYHGPFRPENIDRVLRERDQAASSVVGRGAEMLARLDRMAYEGSITAGEDARRRELFELLCAERHDHGAISALLDAIPRVTALPADTDPPLIGWVRRLVVAGRDSLAAAAGPATSRLGHDTATDASGASRGDWPRRLARLQDAARHGDLDQVETLLGKLRRQPAPPYVRPRRPEPLAV